MPSASPPEYVIGLGSNLGDREALLCEALAQLGRIARIRRVSALYETDPVGPPQGTYLNAAALVGSTAGPAGLMATLLGIERAAGRERRVRWGSRSLDLDILWWSEGAADEDGVVVPHPRLDERAFALVPLVDVRADATCPRTGRRYSELARCLGSRGVTEVRPRGWHGPAFG